MLKPYLVSEVLSFNNVALLLTAASHYPHCHQFLQTVWRLLLEQGPIQPVIKTHRDGLPEPPKGTLLETASCTKGFAIKCWALQ